MQTLNLKINKKSILLIFPIIYIIGGISGTILSFQYGLNKEHITIIFLISVIISYSLLKNRINILKPSFSERAKKNKLNIKIFLLLTLILFIAAILLANSPPKFYHLSFNYFIVICIAALSIFYQIFQYRAPNKFELMIILMEIFLLSLIITHSFLFIFPDSMGNDSFTHTSNINHIIENGEFLNVDNYYNHYPIYHLAFGLIKITTGILNLKYIQFIIGFIQIIFLLFVFLFVKKLFNEQNALLSTLILSLTSEWILPRIIYFPNYFALIFFILIIFLIYKKNQNMAFFSLLLIASIALITTHPFTPIVLLISLSLFYLISQFLFKATKIQWGFYILLLATMMILWLLSPHNQSYDIFGNFIGSLQNAATSFGDNPITYQVSQATLAPGSEYGTILLVDFGFSLLLLFCLIGAFLIIFLCYFSKNKDQLYNCSLVLAILTLILIPIPYLLAIVYPNSLPARWFIFIDFFIGISAAFGLIYLYKKFESYKSQFIILTLCFVMIFFMLTNPTINPNNQLYVKEISGRSALTESELAASVFMNLKVDELFYSNSKYSTLFNTSVFDKYLFINPDDSSTYTSGYILIRNYDMEFGFTLPLYGYEGKLLSIISPNSKFSNFLGNTPNKIYENEIVRLYLNN